MSKTHFLTQLRCMPAPCQWKEEWELWHNGHQQPSVGRHCLAPVPLAGDETSSWSRAALLSSTSYSSSGLFVGLFEIPTKSCNGPLLSAKLGLGNTKPFLKMLRHQIFKLFNCLTLLWFQNDRSLRRKYKPGGIFQRVNVKTWWKFRNKMT